jgi:hypothetical protein
VLRVPPFRGDQVAAGVVVLTALVALLQLRMAWGDGGHLAAAAGATVFCGLLVAGLPAEPRPYVSAILLCTLGLAAVALGRLAQVLGAERVAAGTVAWIAAALGVLAAGLARRHDTANATLVVGLAVAVVPVAFVVWAVGAGAEVQRLMLLLSAVALALGTVALRDRRPTHAAQLANAGGLALVGVVVAPGLARLGLATAGAGGGAGWAWELPVLVGGFGVLAYGAVDRRRGPVLVGLLCIAGFCASAADAGGLLGWPLVMALAAAFMLAVGLRPTTPPPPEPEPGEPADVTRIGRA